MELVKKEERVYYAPAEGAADSIGHMAIKALQVAGVCITR